MLAGRARSIDPGPFDRGHKRPGKEKPHAGGSCSRVMDRSSTAPRTSHEDTVNSLSNVTTRLPGKRMTHLTYAWLLILPPVAQTLFMIYRFSCVASLNLR